MVFVNWRIPLYMMTWLLCSHQSANLTSADQRLSSPQSEEVLPPRLNCSCVGVGGDAALLRCRGLSSENPAEEVDSLITAHYRSAVSQSSVPGREEWSREVIRAVSTLYMFVKHAFMFETFPHTRDDMRGSDCVRVLDHHQPNAEISEQFEHQIICACVILMSPGSETFSPPPPPASAPITDRHLEIVISSAGWHYTSSAV